MRRTGARLVGGLFLIAGTLIASLSGCSTPTDPWDGKPVPHVMTSFVPIYCLARNVVGDDGVVQYLTTNSPHEYDPDARVTLRLNGATLLFVNGLGLDDRIAKLAKHSGSSALKLVALGDKVTKLPANPDDPHVWLGIPQAIEMVDAIRSALKEVAPRHAAGYDQRANEYIGKLKQLQTEGRASLAGKTNRKVVAFHDSLRYFAATFQLEIVGALRDWDGIEADPRSRQALVAECKKHGVRVVVTEPQYPADLAQSLLKEIDSQNVHLAVVDSLETAEAKDLDDPTYYERTMRQNIRNLAESLR